MRNNLNLNYFVVSEYSCAIYAFCKNILDVFQLVALTSDLWAHSSMTAHEKNLREKHTLGW